MSGPWARTFAAVLGAGPAAPVDELRIEVSLITARVGDCTVTLQAPRVPLRIWEAMVRSARGSLEHAVAGEVQSEQLAKLLEHDWEQPLVPPRASVVRVCSCDPDAECLHVGAVVHAVAEAIDADPGVLLRWRGCVAGPAAAAGDDDPWHGGDLPPLPPATKRPPESVPKRFGASGIRVGDEDLVEVLARAYKALGGDG